MSKKVVIGIIVIAILITILIIYFWPSKMNYEKCIKELDSERNIPAIEEPIGAIRKDKNGDIWEKEDDDPLGANWCQPGSCVSYLYIDEQPGGINGTLDLNKCEKYRTRSSSGQEKSISGIKELCGLTSDNRLILGIFGRYEDFPSSCRSKFSCEGKNIDIKAYTIGANALGRGGYGPYYGKVVQPTIQLVEYKDKEITSNEYSELVNEGHFTLVLIDEENAEAVKQLLEKIEPEDNLPVKIFVENAFIEGEILSPYGESGCARTITLRAESKNIFFESIS